MQPVETPFGRKTRIDQTTCNLDFSCLEGDCPSFMTVTGPGRLRSWLHRTGGRDRRQRRASRTPAHAAPEDLHDPVPVVPTDDLSVRIIGIGGTGVVTVSQVIGTAAMFDGYEVRGLDQIGLSQKAGPVVSDLRLYRGAEAASNRLGEGQADVLLAFDQLGAASPSGMSRTDPKRTVVVGSTSQTPTGAVVAHPERAMPEPAELEAVIAASTRADCRHWADAQAITEALLGNSVTANVFVVGMAVQAGALPLSPWSVEQAIELNGVATRSNIEAFRWGRAMVARPDAVHAAAATGQARRVRRPELDEQLAARARDVARAAGFDGTAAGGPTADDDGYRGAVDLELMASELCAFQSPRLAHDHLDFVEAVASADAEKGDGSGRLARAAARGYFKLLAYKDEYEVARLMLDAGATAEARQQASTTSGKLAWKLHPPILRALGMKSKISVPVSWTPAIRLLASMRGLRGTPFDVFGYAAVRRAERSLPGEYRAAVTADLATLDPGCYEAALRRAALPEVVRGYEHIKMAGIQQMRSELKRT
ncbi:MAG: hypothetical protein F4Z26_07870 [Acidimicrobiaceae bacterium]|nr:hypothetical protein [Acidimicrobiaceae bacterium]